MSKTRTGRKGRARLAVAAHLEAIGESDRTAADNFNDAALLDRLNALAKGRGTGGQLFSEGQLMGPLSDSVNTSDGAPNIFSVNETTPFGANVEGETSLVASGTNHTGLGPTFKHHYLQHKAANAGAALALSQAAPLTSSKGIAYLPSGPAADYIPANHGDEATEAYALSIRPDLSELTAVDASSLSNMRFSIVGTAGGYTISGAMSNHTAATAVHKIINKASVRPGSEIRVIGEAGQTLLSIEAVADGYQSAGGGEIDAGGGTLFIVESSTKIYVLEGNDAAIADNNALAAGLVGAVQAWNAVYGTGLVVASDGANQLTWKMNRLRGSLGNNAYDGPADVDGDGSDGVTADYGFSDAKMQPLTVTALKTAFGAQQPLDHANVAGDNWFVDSVDAPADHVAFAGGVYDTIPFNGAGPNALNVQVNGDKFSRTDLDLTITIANTDTAVPGVAIVWSMD